MTPKRGPAAPGLGSWSTRRADRFRWRATPAHQDTTSVVTTRFARVGWLLSATVPPLWLGYAADGMDGLLSTRGAGCRRLSRVTRIDCRRHGRLIPRCTSLRRFPVFARLTCLERVHAIDRCAAVHRSDRRCCCDRRVCKPEL